MTMLHIGKIKSRDQIEAEIPRQLQGWWADVCPGEVLDNLRPATEDDLKRCCLNEGASMDPNDYMCENFDRGSLVSKRAFEWLRPVDIGKAKKAFELITQGEAEKVVFADLTPDDMDALKREFMSATIPLLPADTKERMEQLLSEFIQLASANPEVKPDPKYWPQVIAQLPDLRKAIDTAASLLNEAALSEDGVDGDEALNCIKALEGQAVELGMTLTESSFLKLYEEIGRLAGRPEGDEFDVMEVVRQIANPG